MTPDRTRGSIGRQEDGTRRRQVQPRSFRLGHPLDEEHRENRPEDEHPAGDHHSGTQADEEGAPRGDQGPEEGDAGHPADLASRVECSRGEASPLGGCCLHDRGRGRRHHQGHAEPRRHERHDEQPIGATRPDGRQPEQARATEGEPHQHRKPGPGAGHDPPRGRRSDHRHRRLGDEGDAGSKRSEAPELLEVEAHHEQLTVEAEVDEQAHEGRGRERW